MSHNNFYNCQDNSTFHNYPAYVPPPPTPPPYFIPPMNLHQHVPLTDQEFINQFENKVPSFNKERTRKPSISNLRNEIINIAQILNDIKEKVKYVNDNVSAIPESHWKLLIDDINKNKSKMDQYLSQINEAKLDSLKKLIAKRSSKRLRLKRLNAERKKDKADKINELKEKSRKIDEYLQKIKDNINKVKKEEQLKLQADIILKEVLRKKQDAKKSIVKLDALLKLHKARVNTAKGRGKIISESDILAFKSNIEKLKSVWTQKLSLYTEEEAALRHQLNQDREQVTNATEMDISNNIKLWKEFLFGGELPQANFHGDVNKFIAIRSQWDLHLSSEGSPIPVGWVLPTL